MKVSLLGVVLSTLLFFSCLVTADLHQLQYYREFELDASEKHDEESLLAKMTRSGPIGRRVHFMKTMAAKRRIAEAKNAATDGEVNVKVEENLSVEVPYEDLYRVLIFLGVVFIAGQVAERLGMPSLVGEIIVGFLLGPPLADFVPYAEAIVLFGDIGLILLILEAGIDIDVVQLKVTGIRAFLMAVTGSVVPLAIGFGVATAAGLDVDSALGAGACFSPTSLGVAANALSAGKLLNTPVGQLIIAACVIDDMIGLIFLSELEALVDPTPINFIAPIISSLGFLIVLGFGAITFLPKFIEEKYLTMFKDEHKEFAAFALMIILLMAYLPMLFYTKASYLMGAFLAGLTFSQVSLIHATFIHSTEAIMAWLIRIFFAASIGFQVPVQHFKDIHVVAWGFAFYAAVLGKTVLGLFVPHFEQKTCDHFPFDTKVRDSLFVGIAMTCRGEFSFIIAAFAVDEGLFDGDTYASIVFAVLLSCITSPFILLRVINYYNNLATTFIETKVMPGNTDKDEVHLLLSIQARTGIIWGLQEKVQNAVKDLGLSTFDHRQWKPRGVDAEVVTELYVQDEKFMIKSPRHVFADLEKEDEEDRIAKRCQEVKSALSIAIGQPTAEIEVTQWRPFALDLPKDILNSKTFWEMPEEKIVDILSHEAAEALKKKEEIETKVDVRPRHIRYKSLSGPLGSIFQVDEAAMKADTPEKEAGKVELSKETRRNRVRQTSVPNLATPGLWEHDDRSQQLAMKSVAMKPAQTFSIDSNVGPRTTRRKQKSNLVSMNLTSINENMPVVEDFLTGLVRVDLSNQVEKKLE